MTTLRSKLIRLAHDVPDLRQHLVPLLKMAGREFFYTTGTGRDAESAYKKAVKEARKWHGKNMYSGSIADSFGLARDPIPPMTEKQAEKYMGKDPMNDEMVRAIPVVSGKVLSKEPITVRVYASSARGAKSYGQTKILNQVRAKKHTAVSVKITKKDIVQAADDPDYWDVTGLKVVRDAKPIKFLFYGYARS